MEAGDWEKIQKALDAGLAVGLAEDADRLAMSSRAKEGAPVRAAYAKLDSLREANAKKI